MDMDGGGGKKPSTNVGTNKRMEEFATDEHRDLAPMVSVGALPPALCASQA